MSGDNTNNENPIIIENIPTEDIFVEPLYTDIMEEIDGILYKIQPITEMQKPTTVPEAINQDI